MEQDQQELRAALAEIGDPGGKGNLVAAGRLSSIRLHDGIATIVLDATGLSAAARGPLEEQVRATAAGVEGVLEVRIAMTADKVDRKIIAVGSGKGGVGKSTLSANLAVAMARSGLKVGLVDADIYGPSQPRLMGNSSKPEAVEKQMIPVEAHGVRFLSIGQLVDANSALAWRGPMASNALGQLIESDWADTEVMIIDLPPGTGDVQLSLVQKWKPDGVVIVSTPQDLSLIDARRAIDLFGKTGVPILGLIENMSGYACPHCGETSDPFGSGGAETAANAMSIPFLGRIPLRTTIREASDAGIPPAAGNGEEANLFAILAGRVMERLNEIVT
jgi:ATP-binding protein involved in chromosome partitioning